MTRYKCHPEVLQVARGISSWSLWLAGHEILRLRAQNDTFIVSVYSDANRLESARTTVPASVIASLADS